MAQIDAALRPPAPDTKPALSQSHSQSQRPASSQSAAAPAAAAGDAPRQQQQQPAPVPHVSLRLSAVSASVPPPLVSAATAAPSLSAAPTLSQSTQSVPAVSVSATPALGHARSAAALLALLDRATAAAGALVPTFEPAPATAALDAAPVSAARSENASVSSHDGAAGTGGGGGGGGGAAPTLLPLSGAMSAISMRSVMSDFESGTLSYLFYIRLCLLRHCVAVFCLCVSCSLTDVLSSRFATNSRVCFIRAASGIFRSVSKNESHCRGQ